MKVINNSLLNVWIKGVLEQERTAFWPLDNLNEKQHNRDRCCGIFNPRKSLYFCKPGRL
jgi:hypothetical protein